MGLPRWIAAPLLLMGSLCAPAAGQLLVDDDPPGPWREKTTAAVEILPGPAEVIPAEVIPTSTLVDLINTDLKAVEVIATPQPVSVPQQHAAAYGMYGPGPHGYRRGRPLLGQLLGRQPLANPWNHPSGSSWGYGIFSDKPRRFFGLGDPLTRTSWLNRPYHFDWFFGAMFGNQLVRGGVKQGDEVFGGYRFGADVNHYWGWEARLGLASLPIIDSGTAAAVRSNDMVLWDVSAVYYPWGDARWRPYFGAGLGFANFNFPDGMGANIKETLFGVPWGIGLKYQWKDWLVLRADLTDNWYFGGTHTATQHNFSLTFGVEARFGGSRRNYWPWNPSRYLW